MSKSSVTFTISFLLVTLFCFADPNKPSFKQYVYKTNFGETLNYQLFSPNKVKKNLPIILFLHGSGERGLENKHQTTHVIPQLVSYIQNNQEPCYILAPQCPPKQQWVNISWSLKHHTMPEFPSTPMRLTLELLDEIISKYQLDSNRVYIVGLSMGGYGTWDAIQRKSDYFAAAIPICGGGDDQLASNLVQLPIWAWHGDQDRVVPAFRTRNMIDEITKAGGQPKYTEIKGLGHNSWTPAANHKPLWTWLFKQSKN